MAGKTVYNTAAKVAAYEKSEATRGKLMKAIDAAEKKKGGRLTDAEYTAIVKKIKGK